MKRYKLTVAYDGTNYVGWQIQPNGITIEEVLNRKLSQLTGEEITVIGASRTDSGVHARGNVAVFNSKTTIPPERICYALNQILPEDIVIVNSEEVPNDWHPRYRKSMKTYEYRIQTGRMPDPTRRLTHYFVSYHLDFEKMKEAAAYLVGEHDFAGFCRVRTNAKSTIRTIYHLDLYQEDDTITLQICGNGFLYNMVRMIVGALLLVGRGSYPPKQIKEFLAAKGGQVVKVTAPPQGLMLMGIKYE